MKVAVIGAGMAGLTVARRLQAAGNDVTVFDKSKGTGGRLSSRAYDAGWIDHGAPYLTLETAESLDFLKEQGAAGAMQAWSPETSGALHADERCVCIGVPRNSAITRQLLGPLVFQPSTRIARLEQVPDGWRLYNDGETALGVWSHVIVAVPAPQALPLVREMHGWIDRIRAVAMEPSWVAAVSAAETLGDLADVSVYEHPVIRRITRNSAKPGRRNENIYMVQANKTWSQAQLEDPPEEVGKKILQSFTQVAGARAETGILFTHRWRYALTEIALGQPCLWDAEANLGVCGDWCLGRKVEDAWQSGMELARRILKA